MLKKHFLIFILLVSFNAKAGLKCQELWADTNKLETLSFVATQILKYPDVQSFCTQENFMDLEVYFIPNYFRFQEENDDHYKVMIHYAYSSCTFIYNITKKILSEKSCYSTW